MKRVIKYFILLPFLSACVQDPAEELTPTPDNTPVATVSFEAQIASPEDKPEVKTALGEKYDGKYYPNYWSVGDAISVNGVTSEALTSGSEYVGTSKATFEVNGAVSAPYYFAYPASAIADYSNGSATVTSRSSAIVESREFTLAIRVVSSVRSAQSALTTFCVASKHAFKVVRA